MIDFYASLAHYATDHLLPIWEALAPEQRGTFWCEQRVAPRLRQMGVGATVGRPRRPARTVVVAGAHDVWIVQKAGRHRVVLVEHGAGQAYDTADPGWSGGPRREGVALFLCPNEVSAARNRAAYPSTPALVVGSPHVDALRAIVRTPSSQPTVALSFHHPGVGKALEAGWAMPHYEAALPAVVAQLRAEGMEVIGHGHPRARRYFARLWRSVGVEHVEWFADVVRRASVYVVDNSSTAFEAAACGLPVVLLNAPWYRREVDLWPRFWACADVGVNVEGPGDLVAAVVTALADPPAVRASRRRAVAEVYPYLDGAAARRSAEAMLAVTTDDGASPYDRTHGQPLRPPLGQGASAGPGTRDAAAEAAAQGGSHPGGRGRGADPVGRPQ